MEYDFDQDELFFPVKLNPTQTELLRSLPQVVSPWRNDVTALVTLGLAVSIRRKNSTLLEKTAAGSHYLKWIRQNGK